MQLRKKRRPWTKNERKFAITLFLKSPSAYKYLYKSIVLPGVSTVKKWLSTSEMFRTGFNVSLMSKIKNKASTMSLMEKACVLMFDEMAIKKTVEYSPKYDLIEGFEDVGRNDRKPVMGSQAAVVMVRGLYYQWKFPVGYFITENGLSAEKISELVKESVEKLTQSGLCVKALVCDQCSRNTSAYRMLGVSEEEPYFLNTDKTKIFALYDVPHLLKSVRNNLITHDFKLENEVISFSDIISLYDLDSRSSTTRSAHQLTPAHIWPNNFQKMSVSLAAQVFSHTTSAALKTAVESKEINSKTGLSTSKFLRNINSLYDALNSRKLKTNNPDSCGLITTNTHIIELLNNGLHIFKTLKKINAKYPNPPCFKGFRQTINSVLKLFAEEKCQYLLTSRLNQDPLENLFSAIRQRGGFNKNPSVRTFRSSLRISILHQLMEPPRSTSYDPDMDELLDLYRSPLSQAANQGNPQLIGLSPTKLYKNTRLCEFHFRKEDILPSGRLMLGSIPIRYVPVSESPTESMTSSLFQLNTGGNSVTTPRKYKPTRTTSPCEAVEHSPAVSTSSATFSVQQSPSVRHWIEIASPTSPERERFVKVKKSLFGSDLKRNFLQKLKTKELKLAGKRSTIARLKKKLLKPKYCNIRTDIRHQFKSKDAAILCNMQLRKKRRPWTKNERKFAITLFLKSPSAYKYLYKSIVLPGVSTVKKWLSTSEMFRTGFNVSLMSKIKNKASTMSLMEKACVLMFDEMAIKKTVEYSPKYDLIEGFEDVGRNDRKPVMGSQAAVVMVRGLYYQWKLPVGYFITENGLSAEKISELVKESVEKLTQSGLCVKALVCDQCSRNTSAYRMLGVSEEEPYFLNTDKTKIFALYDVPHLLKSVRNNLITHDFKLENEVISFSDIISLYDLDSRSSTTRSAHQLTPAHIWPNNFQKMSVSLAAQVFSHTTSAALKTAVESKEINSKTGLSTSKFLRNINSLYDALNSRKLKTNNPDSCGLITTNTHIIELLNNGLHIFKTLKKINAKYPNPPCFKGFRQTINSVLKLFAEEKCQYLLTSRLNQDPLENLFSAIRQRGGFNKNPTVRTFRSSLRISILHQLMEPPRSTSYDPDMDELLDLYRSPLSQAANQGGLLSLRKSSRYQGGLARLRKSPRTADKPDVKSKPRSKRKGIGAEIPCSVNSKEDLENKGKKKTNSVGPRSTKKKVLEEANNSKLRRLVEVRVEDCLRRVSKDHNNSITVNVSAEVTVPIVDSESVVEDAEKCVEEETKPVIVTEELVSDLEVVKESEVVASQDDDDGPLSSSSPYSRMELAGDGTTTAALLRFPDDRSDSGVSSLRSGSCASGDERSGSRSSALSSSDEPQQASGKVVIDNKESSGTNKPTSEDSSVRVWRDPSLLLVAEPHVRHVHSVQHQTLLMSHPPGSASSAPPPQTAAPSPHYPPPPPLMSPHPMHHLPPPGTHLYSPLPEMLWKPRYPLPMGTHLHPAPEDLLERERAYAQDRDRHDRLIRDRREQEAREIEKQKERDREREKAERERDKQQERERQDRIERDRIEKQRAAEQAVHKHFEESLRLAHQKRMNTCWNLLSSLPPPARGGEGEAPQAQQRLIAERERIRHDRERVYFSQSQQQQAAAGLGRGQNTSNKVEYPPPAHSRVVGVKPTNDKQPPTSSGPGPTSLPKAEPNFNLFGYPAYQPPLSFLHHDPSKLKQEPKSSQPGTTISSLVVTKSSPVDRDRDMGLPNPPPLMSDLKNSVIVKNEGKSASVESSKPLVSHSQSPKLRNSEPHYLPPAPTSGSQLKTQHYEYRSPSQSPHHMSHSHPPSPHLQYEAQNLASISKVHNVHHRARQSPHPPHRQSPHPPHRQSPHQQTIPHRQSPHQLPQRQSPHPHPNASSPDQRYAPPPGSLIYSKAATVGSYPYPSPAPPPLHYAPTVTTPPKPKVSSPAPPHIYGKPSSGISAGTPICRAQEMRLSPLPLTSKPPLTTSPYQQLPQQHHPPPPHQVPPGVPPPPAHSRGPSSNIGMYDPRLYPPPGPGHAVSVKPPPESPPSRSSPLHLNPGPHLGVTPAFQTQPLDLGVSSVAREEQERPSTPKRKGNEDAECLDIKKRRSEEPVLSRVCEPSPLVASAATTITTVVNTAVTEGLDRPNSAGTPGTPAPPPSCPSPNTPAKPPSGIDSEKSNSPGPPPRPSSYPVHKLKKAWLQRHSGEDGTDDKDIVGSGSCVTLPLTLPNNTVKKEIERTESVNTVNSLHNIGSMAVNSINKTKPKVNRKTVKETPLLNGHASGKVADADDSSSSDPERKALPPKRVPPKVKRKKGGKKVVVEENKRKKQSASSTDSEKESGSDKDSDSGKKSAGGQTDKQGKDSGKKRGRRPKTTQSTLPKNEGGEEPRNKKPRDEPPIPPQRDPFAKPPVGQLKKSGESFLQDGPCFEVAPKLAKCRECRWTPHQRSRNMPNIFCRFYAFRRLRYTKNGQLAIAGFSDPLRDATQDDLKLWLPMPDSPPADLDLDMSRFLLAQVGDQFCDLLEQEKEAISVHMSDDKTIAWKRVVQGVREMCDVCETTLFNFHWACGKCGFVVCIDCYKGRKNGTIKIWGEPGRDRDDLSWLLCTNRQPHEQERLMLTQIIAGDSLQCLGRRVHDSRAAWGIPMHCDCPLATQVKPTNGIICKDLLKNLQRKCEPVNGQIKSEKEDKDNGTDGEKKTDDNNSPLSWLADVALSNEDKKGCEESNSSSDSDEDKDGNYSTLRELLIRPSHKSNGSRAPSPGNNNSNSSSGPTKSVKKSHLDTLDEVISSVIEHSVPKDCGEISRSAPQLKHFIRRYNWAQKGREPLPIRIMTLTESKMLYPDVPHSWLCDGKLLRLMDSNHSGNYRIFQDQWKRGQPVIVSDISKHLDMDLWHPDSFARDFGETKNDLINCMTGNLVPNQPMRKFWEGFEYFSKRLKDERGNAMLLKLKDWPPGEDFAEMLPSRFNELMKVLPLGEYSQRTGRLNLASRLPDCFVRPDLGPKMYTAYGSALHPTKGTTNLHLDISDAVNVMVYVGIPQDGDNDEHIKEAFRAIDEAGCDILTRRRVREKGELPGALWHIYTARDADKIRDLLNKVAIERGARLEPHHDPIHDQSWYLDGPLRERLYKEYAVEGYAIVQCLGDAVFIPAGAPHQVRNLHNCIKVAEDFVSPENVSHCFHLTQEFRELSDTHSNHEDKLQIKNIIYHAVKDALSILGVVKDVVNNSEPEPESDVKQESTDS